MVTVAKGGFLAPQRSVPRTVVPNGAGVPTALQVRRGTSRSERASCWARVAVVRRLHVAFCSVGILLGRAY